MAYSTDGPAEPRRSRSHSFAAIWRRRRLAALVAFAAVLVGGVTMAMSLPDVYRASALVLIEREQISEEFVRPSVTSELETRIQTIHRQVTSRAALERVIEDLGLYRDLRRSVPMDALVNRMRREILFGPSGVDQSTGGHATIAFTVSFSGRDPQQVAAVANTLARQYVDSNTQSRSQQATDTAEFLKKQLAVVAGDLQREEARASAFRQRHSGELQQQVDVNLAALDRLNTQLRMNGEHQLRLMERRERLERERIEAATAATPTQIGESPAARLARAKQDLADLRRRFSESYPDVVRAQTEVAMLEKLASTAPDPNIALNRQGVQEVDAQLATLAKEEQTLRSAIAAYESRIENAPRLEQSSQQILRDYQITSDRYQSLLKRYEEAQLAENLEHGQRSERFRILDEALAPAYPAAPNRQWLLFISVLAALAAAVAVALAAERLDQSIHGPDDLEGLTTVPTLATIPLIATGAGTRRRWLLRATGTLAVGVALIGIVAASYYVSSGNEDIVRLTSRPGA